jgi:drug/metabolite transporter (DMT)-like permease
VSRAYLYTLVVVITWACSMAANKAALTGERAGAHLHPLQAAFWGMCVGWVALAALLAARGRLHHLGDIAARGWAVLVAMGFFGWAGYVVALNVALVKLPMPDAVVINYLHPVFVLIFQGAAFGRLVRPLSGWEGPLDRKHRPGPARLAAGLASCLLGVAVIATEGRLGKLGGLWTNAGALAALFAAFAWGVYSNLGRFVTLRPGRSSAGLSDVHSFLALTFGVGMLAAVLAKSGLTGVPRGYFTSLFFFGWGPAATEVWFVLVFLGVAVYCGGFTLWLYALDLGARQGIAHRLPPLTYLVPVLAVALGWVVLHASFGPGFWTGAALIAAGNLIIQWKARAPGRAEVRATETAPTHTPPSGDRTAARPAP